MSIDLTEGLSERAKAALTSLRNSGQSESIAVADCLNTIAANDDEQCRDEHLIVCAYELTAAADYFIREVIDAVVLKAHGGDRAANLESIANSVDTMLEKRDTNGRVILTEGDARKLEGWMEQTRIIAMELSRIR